MEKCELYLKRIEEGFKLVLDSFNPDVMSDDYFLLKEAAVVIIYPDGSIDAMRNGAGIRHNFYYRKIYASSPRFKKAVDSLEVSLCANDESTYFLDCRLSDLGVSSLHNMDMEVIPIRLSDLDDFAAMFYLFKSEHMTKESNATLQYILENYNKGIIVKNVYNSQAGRFEAEAKGNVRSV